MLILNNLAVNEAVTNAVTNRNRPVTKPGVERRSVERVESVERGA